MLNVKMLFVSPKVPFAVLPYPVLPERKLLFFNLFLICAHACMYDTPVA